MSMCIYIHIYDSDEVRRPGVFKQFAAGLVGPTTHLGVGPSEIRRSFWSLLVDKILGPSDHPNHDLVVSSFGGPKVYLFYQVICIF